MVDVPNIMTAAQACEKFASFPLVQAYVLDKASFIAGYEMAVMEIRAALNPLPEKAAPPSAEGEYVKS